MSKPIPYSVVVLDFIEAVHWCEQFREGLERRILEYLAETTLRGNDSYASQYFSDFNLHVFPETIKRFTEDDIRGDIAILIREFPCLKSTRTLLWVSW